MWNILDVWCPWCGLPDTKLGEQRDIWPEWISHKVLASFQVDLEGQEEEGLGAFLPVLNSHPSHSLTPWQSPQNLLWPGPQWSWV